MEKQTSNEATQKIITFVAFGVLLTLGIFFLLGVFAREETFGISRIIDEIKLISKDAKTYFKEIVEEIKAIAETLSKEGGFALLCITILHLIFPLSSILFFFMVILHLALSWIPLVRVGDIGWNKACKCMSKKLKKVAAWVLSYVIYAFTLYGSSVVKLTAIGNMVLWLIAAYAVAKILLNALGRRDTMLHMVLNTVWTAVIAVFLTLVFKHFLSLEGSLWASLLSNLEEVILAKNSQLRKVALMGVLYSLCFYISIQISAKAISKQMVKRSIGVRVALICMFVFLVLAAVFNFCMFKNIYDKITFGDWRKMEGNKMIIRSVVYGLIGFVLAIVTPFVTQIGKPQTKEEETSVQ